MADKFQKFYPHLESPAENGYSIVPSNVSDLPYITRKLYVGGTGNIVLNTSGGDNITLVGVQIGTVLNIRASRVFSTGTTATNIVGLY